MFLIKYNQMFVENNDLQQHGHAGNDVHLNERPSLQYSFFSARNFHNNIMFIVIYS